MGPGYRPMMTRVVLVHSSTDIHKADLARLENPRTLSSPCPVHPGRPPRAALPQHLPRRIRICIKWGSGIALHPRLCESKCADRRSVSILRRPETLPYAQNSPQKNKYDLYAEGVSGNMSCQSLSFRSHKMTGSSFVAPRAESMSTSVFCSSSGSQPADLR